MAAAARPLDRLARRFATLCVFVVGATAAAAGQPADSARTACPDDPESFATVADVSDDFTLVLSDGRRLRLAGIETPRATSLLPSRPQDVRDMLRAKLRNTTVGLAPLGPVDRWNAVPAIVFAEDGVLSQSLLMQGLARVQPDTAARACRESLLQAESAARQAPTGVWRDPALAVIDADGIAPYGTPALDALEGLAVVEGKVVSVGETPARIYLNLGHRRGGFAISLPKRDIALMASDAVRRARTIGTRLRVRGLVDYHTGLRVDVSDADAIEIIGTDAGHAASPSP